MKALFTSNSARQIGFVIAVFLGIAPFAYPELLLPQVVLASDRQSGENQPIVFEVKDPSLIQKSLSFEALVANDPLAAKLKTFLEERNSPLAPYAPEIIQLSGWQRALAISWVESNFCVHSLDKNCSGIGVEPGHPSWRKYPTYLEWFKDMTALLQKPIYTEKYNTFEKMKGVYVQPGSTAWVYGAKTTYAKLMALTKEAEEERQALAQNGLQFAAAATSNPELAQLK